MAYGLSYNKNSAEARRGENFEKSIDEYVKNKHGIGLFDTKIIVPDIWPDYAGKHPGMIDSRFGDRMYPASHDRHTFFSIKSMNSNSLTVSYACFESFGMYEPLNRFAYIIGSCDSDGKLIDQPMVFLRARACIHDDDNWKNIFRESGSGTGKFIFKNEFRRLKKFSKMDGTLLDDVFKR